MERKSISVREFLFYLYFTIMLLTKGFGLASGVAYKCALAVSVMAVVLKLFIDDLNWGQWICVLVLLTVGLLDWKLAGNQAIIVCVTSVLAVKDIDLKHAFKWASLCWGTVFFIQIIMHILNLQSTDFVIHNKPILGYVIRWSLGYVHPNVLMIAFCVLVFYYYYSHDMEDRKSQITCFMLAVSGAVYVFMYSISITGVLLFIMFFVFLSYFEINRRHKRKISIVEKLLIRMIFPAAVLFSVVVPFMFEGEALYQFSRIFTHRPRLSRIVMDKYGIALLGRSFPDLPSTITLDCSYVNLLEYGGLIIFIIMCVAYVFFIEYLLSEKPSRENSVSLAITISVIIAAMSEPFAFNTSFKNPTLFLIGGMFYAYSSKWNKTVKVSGYDKKLKRIADDRIVIYDIEGTVSSKCKAMYIRQSKESVRKRFAYFIVCGVVAAIVCTLFIHMPGKVYALRNSCDTDMNPQNYYFTNDEVQEIKKTGDWFLNYKDEQTPVLMFEGSIIEYERIRYCFSSFVFGGSLGLFIIVLLNDVCTRQKNRREKIQ